ncbi:uncharacterized protein N7484_006964 [Penicillium longicatenatum]|uniref:uncharacterized protein n=1 Tax=Penicillium longicatenatum TaxID=1561947 RepID=UPI002546850D|nr:uncharacterized protein N7484_006964 [Penicillium longicatenatum]KAJ5639102.1 hypothetical protein N7484_006964 [Penicillium longicatenatum]
MGRKVGPATSRMGGDSDSRRFKSFRRQFFLLTVLSCIVFFVIAPPLFMLAVGLCCTFYAAGHDSNHDPSRHSRELFGGEPLFGSPMTVKQIQQPHGDLIMLLSAWSPGTYIE